MPSLHVFAPEEKEAFIARYLAGEAAYTIAPDFGVSKNVLYHHLRLEGVTIRGRHVFTPEETEKIIARYLAREPSKSIAPDFGVVHGLILRHLREQGIAVRDRHDRPYPRFAVNESAFDEPSEARDYAVGLLMADGCVHYRKSGQATITLTLAAKDAGLVEWFRQFLSAENPARTYSSKKTGRRFTTLAIWSDRLADALATFGVIPRKSNREHVLLLESSPHFWRGMMDGDGSIAMGKRHTGNRIPELSLCGSRTILSQFLAYAQTVAPGISRGIYQAKGICRTGAGGRFAQEIVRALYGNAIAYLPRKYDRALEIIAWKPQQVMLRHLTPEQLNALYAEHGTWTAVAKHLGTSQPALSAAMRRLANRTA